MMGKASASAKSGLSGHFVTLQSKRSLSHLEKVLREANRHGVPDALSLRHQCACFGSRWSSAPAPADDCHKKGKLNACKVKWEVAPGQMIQSSQRTAVPAQASLLPGRGHRRLEQAACGNFSIA